MTSGAPTQLYAYDALNRLSSLTQPWTGADGGTAVTTYAYDVQDHLTAVTDAEGNTTTYVYSDRDLMTREVSPVSGTTTFTYDEHGELVNEIDARGVSMTRTVTEGTASTLYLYLRLERHMLGYPREKYHEPLGRLSWESFAGRRNNSFFVVSYDYGRLVSDE